MPKDLRNLSDTGLKKYVEKQRKVRSEIKKEINELNKKQRIFVAKRQTESVKKNELESVLIKAIKRQAMRKNYSW